jgi:hypothetical protein
MRIYHRYDVVLIDACNAQMGFLVDKNSTFHREFNNGPSP